MQIEVLKARIAPASVLSYTDIDGDTVKIKSSTDDLAGSATLDDADNTNSGDSHDASMGARSPSILAAIASISISGRIVGTPGSVSTSDHFCFVAQQIGPAKIGGTAILLASGAHNDKVAIAATGDGAIHEV